MSYCEDCEADKKLKGELEKHLGNLKRQRGVTIWQCYEVMAGADKEVLVNAHLHSAQVILLLVSADYISSDYCYEKEMLPAMKRHDAGEACVIPILLRSTDLVDCPLEQLQVLPSNGKSITLWEDRDEAFYSIACSIREVIGGMG